MERSRFVWLTATIACNVLWSYVVMNIGVGDAETTAGMLVRVLSYYAGYIVMAAVMLLIPSKIERWEQIVVWPLVLALLMLTSTTLVLFSTQQGLFDAAVTVAVIHLITGATCTLAIAGTYLPLLRAGARASVAASVLVAHALKMLFSACFVIAGPSTVAVAVAYALPVGTALFLRKALSIPYAAPGLMQAPVRETSIDGRGWACIIAVAAGVIACDLLGSTDIWVTGWRGASVQVADALLLLVAGVAGAVLFAVSIGALDRPPSQRYGMAFLVMLTAGVLFAAGQLWNLGDAVGFPLLAIAFFGHPLSWVVTYDWMHSYNTSPYRIFGTVLLVETLLTVVGIVVGSFAPGAESAMALITLFVVLVVAVNPSPPSLPSVQKTRERPCESNVLAPATETDTSNEVDTLSEQGLRQALWSKCESCAEQYGLSSREQDVLFLLSQGRTRQSICNALFLSESTVKTHVEHIYAKLQIHSQTELADVVFGIPDQEEEDRRPEKGGPGSQQRL